MFSFRFLSSPNYYFARSLRFGSSLLLAVSIASISGCGPRLSDEELGHIQKNVTDAPGAQTLYQLPDLTEEIVDSENPAGADAAGGAKKD